MMAPPVAFTCSLIGLIRGQSPVAAVVGMVLSSLCLFLFFGMPVLTWLCS
jgi:hypothetical protein